ncbi:hypoxanthine phosphoribosyltransferase [Sediminibacterium sp.]|jgi:hypoxanthine phosphoribosyltransferase|uniref:hypoxanthine phosphoribosyltransferase n=1 Tax=Sediminibacterium sp. TaxID=1917865 RepID=UPI000BCB9525|nr:hypoxanthine phosphoribosyltransferase [Sediminibacterium sp.]OYY23042.1 MAG: hypoxanthine phosphoribosyltransferase [Sphingobacteriia bacterium 35-40-8]OYZ53620.1 MAG: hypoxanthine phosphoribosyltransferase [Sphingobacteriia bacterium 24-36-13]OZA63127.1 MAG: hypoxanthine phosphoribosyltransferase [Sphingobacteriia bacterium 39-36-14]MDO8995374.1 hypoxanthine phosphoribosyltransferase [Sediminibacterium sp.]MDO9156358.1 hypoxanthine phosphoribosyltransferase [Sediminibacterium sp.]
MSNITLFNKTFEPYLPESLIQEKIKELGEIISKEYEGKRPLFIGVLNGSFMFAADLFKQISIEAEICFIKLASYKGTKSTGNVITAIGLDTDIRDRHLILLEDIIDTGKTMNEFIPQLYHQQPASIKMAVLLHKPDATIYPVQIDYCCFSIPDRFVLGYGLDYDGFGRNLKEIYQLKESE